MHLLSHADNKQISNNHIVEKLKDQSRDIVLDIKCEFGLEITYSKALCAGDVDISRGDSCF